ncbi:hypothetical protein KCP70_15985 [Salmonella enterica subsp. enterica]|nr:hypothetical protein KCP70_15985 [Salmonella enterica subsp. enterica]
MKQDIDNDSLMKAQWRQTTPVTRQRCNYAYRHANEISAHLTSALKS